MAENKSKIFQDAAELRVVYDAGASRIAAILRGVTVANHSDVRELKAREMSVREIKRMKVQAVAWIREKIPEIYNLSRGQALVKMKRIHVENLRQPETKSERAKNIESQTTHAGLYILKATDSINRFVGAYLGAIGDAARKLDALPQAKLQAYDQRLRNEAMKVIEYDYEKALSLDEITRDLVALFEDYLDGEAFIEVGERFMEVGAYSEMLARTELSRAMSQATLDECKEWGDDLVMVSSHSDPCAECAELEGVVFSISGSDEEYEPLPDWPPHPNCEHNLLPTSREIISLGAYENSPVEGAE